MEPVRHTASGGIVVAQGTYLLHAYVPMPPPQGDTFGLERWGGGEHQRSPDTTAEPAHRPGGAVADYSSAAAAWTASRRRKNVLIIGDSLVVGIGCRDSMVLPQGICRQLSDRLGVDISWRAVGVNGGDVRTIHQEVLDTVKRFQLDREARYHEYLASLCHDAAGSAAASSSAAPGPAGCVESEPVVRSSTGSAAGGGCEAGELPHHRYSVVQQTPPHLEGAGAALFDFVASRDFVKKHYPKLVEGTLGERVFNGRGRAMGASEGEQHACDGELALTSEPSPKVDAVIVLCGLNDLKRILTGRLPA